MTAADENPPASLLDIPVARPDRAAAETAPEAGVPARRSTSTPPPEPANDTQAPAVEPEPARAPVAAPGGDSKPARALPRDLYAYWRRLARDGLADVDAVDAGGVAERWPYTLLLRGRPDAPLDIVRVFRPAGMDADGGGDGAGHPLAGDLCSQVSSWALALARDCVVTREPAVDVERFVLAGTARTYRGLALPCRRSGERWTYVLLYLHAMGGGRTP